MANNNVFLAETELRVGEASGVANVVIVRTGSLESSVLITYGVTADTATAGQDFIGGFGTVTMAPGVASITVPVTVLNDALGEPTETFGFSIVDVAGATLWAPRTMRISILDDETPAPPLPAEPPLISAFNVEQQVLAAGLNTPIKIEFPPFNANLVYVAEKGGVIKLVNITTGVTNTVADFSAKVNDVQDRGLMDIVLDPNFVSNRYIYAFYVAEPADTAGKIGLDAPDANGNRYAHVVRMTADAAGTGIIAGSEKILVGGAGQSLADISGLGRDDFTNPAYSSAVSSERFNVGAHGQMVVDGIKQDYIKLDSITHAGGALAFGPDGKLYIAIGDGTAFDFADPRTVDVQSLNSLSGKVLRVDPATGQGLTDNPFYDSGMSLDANASKVFQLGLRNPFASAFDSEGRLFLSNTGWFTWEMIQTGGGGANFGWPFFEGADGGVLQRATDYENFIQAPAFYAAVANGSIIVTPPFRAFSHDSAAPGFAVTAITGSSSIYTGNAYPAELKNDFFFQDFADGEIYSVDTLDRTKLQFLYRADGRPIDFVQGPDGFMYYVDIFTNELGRLNITTRQTGPAVDIPLPPIGSGTDVLKLRITQDEWNGSAQFIVLIDGQQIGGIQTVSAAAERGNGTVNTLDVLGSFAVGQHTVGVTFLNDGWDGTLANDRNLYVESASYNGVAVGGATPLLTMLDGSPRFFSVNDTTPVGTTPPPPTGADISLGAIGSGSDTLRLRITQDEWNGSAQFIVLIDGQQIGGIQTVSAAAERGNGTVNTLDVLGSFAVGQHTVGVTFLNDGWDGTLANDRNLYVESASYNGVAVGGATPLLTMLDGSPRFFSVNDTTPVGTTPPPPPPAGGDISLGAVGSGSDTLRLRITQDEWNGSAQFTVSIDGRQIGGTQTVSAAAERGSGTVNTLDVLGSFAPGQHTVSISFLNDAWDGTAANDRNLYIESATYDGAAVGGPLPLLAMLDGGTRSFAVSDFTLIA